MNANTTNTMATENGLRPYMNTHGWTKKMVGVMAGVVFTFPLLPIIALGAWKLATI